MPRRLNAFCSSLPASSSSCGIRCGSISMIVTSLPKRSKIDANSQPMMPPPSTTSRRGTSVCARSPVESTHRGESRPGIGGVIGYEPVATIALLKVTSSPPSTAIEVVLVKRPVPAHPLDAVRLEERCDAACHLLHDGRLPLRRPGRSRAAARRRRRRASRTSRARRGGRAPSAPMPSWGCSPRAGRCRRARARARCRRPCRRAAPRGSRRCSPPGLLRGRRRQLPCRLPFVGCRPDLLTMSVARSVNESSVSPTCSKPCCW